MKIKIKYKWTSDERIKLVLFVFLSYNIITLFINTIVNFVMPGTAIDTAICMGCYSAIILYALPKILKRIRNIDILVCIVVIMIFLYSFCLFPEGRIYIYQNYIRFFFQTLPLFFLGRCIKDYTSTLIGLLKLAKFMIILGACYYLIVILTNQEIPNDNMSFSYFYLTFCILANYEAIHNFSIFNLFLCVLGFCILVLCGTRGPLVCWAISILAYTYLLNTKVKIKIIMTFIIGIIIVFLCSEEFIALLTLIDAKLSYWGIDNRILDKMLGEDFLVSKERDEIFENLVNGIKERPIIGYGLYGDRVVSGGYAHNIILEILATFGIALGGLLMILFACICCNRIYSKKVTVEYKAIIILLVCTGVVKLFMSGSFMQEPNLFLLLGILLSPYRKKTPKSIVGVRG